MQASALSHYHAFLDSAECMAVVRKQLIAAVEGLSALADSVPALGAALEAFSSDAAGVMAQHAAIKQLAGVCCMCAHVHGSSRCCMAAVSPASPACFLPGNQHAHFLVACCPQHPQRIINAREHTYTQSVAPRLRCCCCHRRRAGQQLPLSELLDAPSLMDTCVRSGAFDEALDLQAFVARLALLHPDVPLVKMLEAQAASVSQVMLAQLLQRLRGPVQLPECLRVVGHLRRMAAFPEPELRLQFLCCR